LGLAVGALYLGWAARVSTKQRNLIGEWKIVETGVISKTPNPAKNWQRSATMMLLNVPSHGMGLRLHGERCFLAYSSWLPISSRSHAKDSVALKGRIEYF
jgi:hypothetical protein